MNENLYSMLLSLGEVTCLVGFYLGLIIILEICIMELIKIYQLEIWSIHIANSFFKSDSNY
jgi:hypothetical protein